MLIEDKINQSGRWRLFNTEKKATLYGLFEIKNTHKAFCRTSLPKSHLPAPDSLWLLLSLECTKHSNQQLFQLPLEFYYVFTVNGNKCLTKWWLVLRVDITWYNHIYVHDHSLFMSGWLFVGAPKVIEDTMSPSAGQSKSKSNWKSIDTIASSAVTFQLVYDGGTAHSAFQVPTALDEYYARNACIYSRPAGDLRRSDLAIYSEIILSQGHTLQPVGRTLRTNTPSSIPFARNAVLLVREFCQVLPIVRYRSQSQIISASFKNSARYSLLTRHYLHNNMRLSAAPSSLVTGTISRLFPALLFDLGEVHIQFISP